MHYDYKTENACGTRPTSCADQFSKAIEEALAAE